MRVIANPLAICLVTVACLSLLPYQVEGVSAAQTQTAASEKLDAVTNSQLQQLEQKYFDHTFEAEDDLPARVERLEKQIFGDTVVGALPLRIRKMAETLPPPPEADKPTLPAAVPSNSGPGQTQGRVSKSAKPQYDDDSDEQDGPRESYPRVTSLEQIILGESFPSQPLAERIAKMETKAFGKPSDSDDLSLRTDNLEHYADKTLHKKPLGLEQNREFGGSSTGAGNNSGGSAQQSGQSTLPKQLVNLVGNSLLGVASSALGVPMFVPALAGAGLRSGGAMQTPGNGQPQADTPAEDPAVYNPEPPPQSARLLTKVGWCEVQVFGRTFAPLHLKERLRQLSRELNVGTNQTDLELMDDIASFVKAAQLHKRTAQQ